MPLTTFALDGFAFQRADPQELLSLLQSTPGVEVFQDTHLWWNVRTQEMCVMEQCSGYEAILLPNGEEVHLDYEGRDSPVVCRWIKERQQKFFREADCSSQENIAKEKRKMRMTLYTMGAVENLEDMQRLAQLLECVAASVRQGNTADPFMSNCSFFVENDLEKGDDVEEEQCR